MKKKFLSVALIMALLAGVCNVAMAADTNGATRNSLKSRGTIEYRKGNDKVVINAGDLYMLADQIDQVKLGVTDQLEAMNTYFTAGDGISLSTDRHINVTHARPSGSNSVNPLSVDFDTILEGIAASQSVSSDITVYGYSSGTKLYKGADGSLTTDGSVEGATQITVSAATAENLSAGTVAWVNGQLILGTGGDNKSYFDSGAEKKEPDSSSSGGVEKAEVINMCGDDNRATSYVVQEDMTDVFLYFWHGNVDNTIPSFTTLPSDPEVSCKEVLTYGRNTYGADFVSGGIYYIPSLKRGTTISGFTSYAYLFKTKTAGSKGNVTKIDMNGFNNDRTAYTVASDIQDAYIITYGNITPKFEPLTGNPIVAYKKIVNQAVSVKVASQTMGSIYSLVYYIPELKAGTLITDYGESYLVY